MSIYVIADLHLSFSVDKPMDVFGNNWEYHADKIKRNWIEKVKPGDTVILPGDFSWATYLDESKQDFEYLAAKYKEPQKLKTFDFAKFSHSSSTGNNNSDTLAKALIPLLLA